MKPLTTLVMVWLASPAAMSQRTISVTVHPGTELLNVIHVLSDTAQITKSTYQTDILHYFGQYRNHPAVQKARALPFINCDFPLRMSWAFYNFPHPRLYVFDTLGAYNKYFSTAAVLDYFRACLDFYKDSRFDRFFKNYQPQYQQWINSFRRNLYEAGLLAAMDSFYRRPPSKEIVFTLGALNCGSYALPDMNSINPRFNDKMVIMVAYGNMVRRKDSLHRSPDFYQPAWASQLIWHEGGHAYIASLFKRYQQPIDSLQGILARDTVMQKAAGPLSWSMYLNENLTQAVTSLLRIRRGIIGREAELKRLASGQFYRLSPFMISLLEKEYLGNPAYPDFEAFFPVLLGALGQL